MALPATEDFTGAAGTLAGSWTQGFTDFSAAGISRDGSGLGVGPSGTDGLSWWNADAFAGDQYGQCAVSNMAPTGPVGGPAVRCTGGTSTAGKCYLFQAGGTAGGLYKNVLGTFTQFAVDPTTWVNGDVARLEASGTTQVIKKNGVQVGSTGGDSAIPSGGAPGIEISGLGNVDNWQGGNLVAASAAVFSYGTRRAPGQRGPFDQRGFLMKRKFDYTPSAAPIVTVLQRKTLSQTGNHAGGRSQRGN